MNIIVAMDFAAEHQESTNPPKRGMQAHQLASPFWGTGVLRKGAQ